MAQFPVCKGRVGAVAIFRSRYLVNTWVVEAHHRGNAAAAAVEVHRRDHNRVVVAHNTDRPLLVHLCLGLASAICCVISEEIHDTPRHSNREEVRSRATCLAVVDNREVEVREVLLASDVAVEDYRIVVDNSHYFQEAYVEVDNGAGVDIVVEVEAAVTGLLHRRLALPEAEDRRCHFLRPVSAAYCFALPARVTLQSPF